MQQRSPAFYALIIIGILLIVGGLIYGLSSRQTSYKSIPQGTIAHYLTSDGTGYLQMDGNSAIYVVHEDNFSPKINSFADGDTISFVYDPGATTSVDVTSTIGTHLTGTATKVVEITAFGNSNQTAYKTPEYTADPQGYNHNQWGIGIALMVVGLLLAIGSFFVPKKKAPAMSTPAPFAGTLMYEQQQYPSYPQQGMPQYPQQTIPQQPQYPQQGMPQYPQQPPYSPQQSYQSQQGQFQQTPFTGNPQSNPFGQPQSPNPYGQTAYGQPQQPNPYGQPQPPNQQGQYPNPYGQPPQQ